MASSRHCFHPTSARKKGDMNCPNLLAINQANHQTLYKEQFLISERNNGLDWNSDSWG